VFSLLLGMLGRSMGAVTGHGQQQALQMASRECVHFSRCGGGEGPKVILLVAGIWRERCACSSS